MTTKREVHIRAIGADHAYVPLDHAAPDAFTGETAPLGFTATPTPESAAPRGITEK